MHQRAWCPQAGFDIGKRVFAACLLVANGLPAQSAGIHAYQDAAGHLRWTNVTSDGVSTVSAQRLVEVLPGTETAPGPVARSPQIGTELKARASKMLPLVRSAAHRHGLDPATLLALIDVESSFSSTAVSPKGARGLMQLMPATARRYGLRHARDLHDPLINLDIGARHLSELLALHRGNLALALASYNAGAMAVKRHGSAIPAYRETMLYVPAILGRMEIYRSIDH